MLGLTSQRSARPRERSEVSQIATIELFYNRTMLRTVWSCRSCSKANLLYSNRLSDCLNRYIALACRLLKVNPVWRIWV